MMIVETIAKIRRMYYVKNKGIKMIARELRLSKNTVKKVIREDQTSKTYIRNKQALPIMGEFKNQLTSMLESNVKKPLRLRYTAKKLHQALCDNGFKGSYSTVNRFTTDWRRNNHAEGKKVFIPLEFAPGEAFQFDWSTEEIELQGVLTRVKVAHIRLCYSRLFLLVVYRNEKLEMVFDAHNKAFQFFEGTTKKGIYDNMKTAVQKVFVGKNRKFNLRFEEMASHYLFEPIACTPAAGWEKGQVENQVSTGRRNFFTPLRCVNKLEEFNKQLCDECIEWAQKTAHPEFKERKVWDVYLDEKPSLLEYRYPFDAYKTESSVVSSYSLINYDTNMYSVDCDYVSKVAEVRAYADKIIIVFKGKIIGEHERCFEKKKKIYNPWHYIAVLERKPGALRNGAPFKHLKLPQSLINMRKNLGAHEDGDKQFIKILLQVSAHGLERVNEACASALKVGISDADFIKKSLAPNVPQEKPEECRLQLIEAPTEDLHCYNNVLLNSQLNLCQEADHAI
ncbi:MAG: IS21 family transposase [Bacteroidetes bacterium]|nr:IS21 family transposase [Bacteroidota bacterium]